METSRCVQVLCLLVAALLRGSLAESAQLWSREKQPRGKALALKTGLYSAALFGENRWTSDVISKRAV